METIRKQDRVATQTVGGARGCADIEAYLSEHTTKVREQSLGPQWYYSTATYPHRAKRPRLSPRLQGQRPAYKALYPRVKSSVLQTRQEWEAL